jgi:branched-chain amino acid transport system permease protein
MTGPLRDRWSGSGRWGQVAVIGTLLSLAIVPFSTTPYVTEIVLTGLVFVILGVSWNLLAGYAGQISLGHAAFFGIGAFVTAWLTSPGGADLPQSIAIPGLLAVVVGGLAAALLAGAIGPIIFRLRGHYFAIGTLALATIIQLILVDQRELTGGSAGYYLTAGPDSVVVYMTTLVAAVLVTAITYVIVHSPPGLAMRAIHGDEDAADGLGVNPLKYKMYAFVVSSFFAGLAGGFYALYTRFINPETTLGIVWTIDTLVIVILGGMGTMAGPLLGTALFLALDNFLADIVGGLATTVEGLLIILIVIFLPAGLYGFLSDRLPGEGPSVTSDASAGGETSEDR